MKVEHQFNKNLMESETMNTFLSQAIQLVKKSGDSIQEEFKELDVLREKKETLQKEKFKVEKKLYKLEADAEKKHAHPEPYGWQEPDKEGHDDTKSTPSQKEEEAFHKANELWEDEVTDLDHHDVRMLNKIRRLENIVENSKLILDYVENNGTIYLSQLDKFISEGRPEYDNKSTMNDIDNLCLNCKIDLPKPLR